MSDRNECAYCGGKGVGCHPVEPAPPAEGPSLDFEAAMRGPDGDRWLDRDTLNTQHREALCEVVRAALARVREEYQGRIKGVEYVVEAVEWSHPSNDIPEGATRLTIKGVIQPVGAGDTILYRRLEVR